MPNPMILLGAIIATFLLAGLVKGVTGLALPTVGYGTQLASLPGVCWKLISSNYS
jgi:hypothetical protein